ncbi:uncharacterized protein LOC115631500 [Scaptodrosophila lebanonensis]|uniref:Uncharacterized protein LOC115631500 n=1 Tax=Drosophila lebanonensis TaxID=7225 RepID=A0A6J2U807_DROLE|nr:uncharacterized protein LOC115631500 [Scaptodrosophila lebanonensis]
MADQDTKLPTWLRAEIFEDLLKQQVKGYTSTKALRASAGVPPGDNYATIMLRVELDVETEDKSNLIKAYMLKIPHQSERYREMMKKTNIFDIEQGMYTHVVPELEQLYKDVGLSVKFGASTYEIPAGEDYVLLEDLRPKGFKNANRLDGLDTVHTKCVLRKLAQWHAAAAVRVDAKGPYEEKYRKGFFNDDNREVLVDMNGNNMKSFLKHIKEYKGLESYVEDFQQISQKMVDVISKMSEPDPNEFNTLNHGDCWSNNIMFQYNESGDIQETYFVDLQIPKYGTVAQDLFYFLLTSTNLDIKLSKFEYFIQFYHAALIEHLKLLNYKRNLPTLKGIHQALVKYGSWGFFSVVNIMGVVLLDPNENASFDSFFEEGEENSFKKSVFTNQRYRRHMEAIVPWLQNRGALE